LSWLIATTAGFLVLAGIGLGCRWRARWNTLALLLALAGLGIVRHEQVSSRMYDARLAEITRQEGLCELLISVQEEPENRDEDSIVLASTEQIVVRDTVFHVQATLLVRFRKFQPGLEYGDRVTLIGELKRPNTSRNPGAFDYRGFLARKGIWGIATVRTRDQIVNIERGGGTWLWTMVVLPVRHRIRQVIDRNLSGAPAGLLKGVLLGEKRGVPDSVRTDFARAGVNHVLAVSGLHVGLIAAVVFFVLRTAGAGRSLTSWLTIAALALYALVTGMPASVLRASTMGTVVILGMLGGREGDGLNTLGLAGLVLLYVSPMDLYDVGFQLSFSATGGILILHQPIRELLPGGNSNFIGKYVLTPFAVSLAAQAGTLPLVATYFGHISIVSLVANLVVVPMIGASVALGIAAILYSLVLDWLTTLFNGANWVILQGAIVVAKGFASPGWAYLEVPKPGWKFSGIFVCLMLMLVAGIRTHRVGRYLPFLLIVLGNWWVWAGILSNPPGFEMVVLDVGQGDGIFLRFPNGRIMMVDGGLRGRGTDAGERVLIPFLRERGYRKIDVVVASHPHSDHIGGLVTLLERIQVGHYLDAGQHYGSWTARRIRTLIQEKDIRYTAVAAGDSLVGLGGVEIVVLHPSGEYVSPSGEAPHGLNNGSVVLHLRYGASSILLTGDIERETDPDLIRWGAMLEADVLKAAHHGSRTSSTQQFLDILNGKLALVSCGVKNKFRHPAPEVITRYESMGMEVVRTDLSGALSLSVSRDKIRINKWLQDEIFHVATN